MNGNDFTDKFVYVCNKSVTSSDEMTLLVFAAHSRPCSNRSISSADRAHSSKPTAAACGDRPNDGKLGRTDERTLDSGDSFRPWSSACLCYANIVNCHDRLSHVTHN